jgi:hypothetical protein
MKQVEDKMMAGSVQVEDSPEFDVPEKDSDASD